MKYRRTNETNFCLDFFYVALTSVFRLVLMKSPFNYNVLSSVQNNPSVCLSGTKILLFIQVVLWWLYILLVIISTPKSISSRDLLKLRKHYIIEICSHLFLLCLTQDPFGLGDITKLPNRNGGIHLCTMQTSVILSHKLWF